MANNETIGQVNIPQAQTERHITGAEFDRRQNTALGNAASREALENDPLNGFLNPGVSPQDQAMSRLTNNILTEHSRDMSHPAARAAAVPERAVQEDNPGLAAKWAGSVKEVIKRRRDAKATAEEAATNADPNVQHVEQLGQAPAPTANTGNRRPIESSVPDELTAYRLRKGQAAQTGATEVGQPLRYVTNEELAAKVEAKTAELQGEAANQADEENVA